MLLSLRATGDVANEDFDGTPPPALRIGTSTAVNLIAGQPASSLPIRTGLRVSLTAQTQSSSLDIPTSAALDLRADQPVGTISILTGLRVDLERGQAGSSLDIPTSVAVSLVRGQAPSALSISTSLRVTPVAAPRLGLLNLPTSLAVDLVRGQAGSSLNISTSLQVSLVAAPQQLLGLLDIPTSMAVNLVPAQAPSALNILTSQKVDPAAAPRLGLLDIPTSLAVELARAQAPSALNISTGLQVSLAAAPRLGSLNIPTSLAVDLVRGQAGGLLNISTGLQVSLIRAAQPGTLNFSTSQAVVLAPAPQSSVLPVGTSLAVSLAPQFQTGSVTIPTSMAVALVAEQRPSTLAVSTGLQMALVRAQAPSTLSIPTSMAVALASEQRPSTLAVSTGLQVSLAAAPRLGSLSIPTSQAVVLALAPQSSVLPIRTSMAVSLAPQFQGRSLDIPTSQAVTLVAERAPSTLAIGTSLAVDLIRGQRPSTLTVPTSMRLDLARAQAASTLNILTSQKVDLEPDSPPSTLMIGTSMAVALVRAQAPSTLNIPTSMAVNLARAQALSVLPVRTSMAVAVAAGQQPSQLTIRTSMKVLANGAALRVRTSMAVGLIRGQSPGAAIPVGTRMTVSLTAGNQPAFGFNRDLVIAGQTDLATITPAVTQIVLLGITFTDPDFRSVANAGRIQQTGAEDVQFELISNGTVLNHNIVSHDPVGGTIVFDLQLPSWNVTSDVPVRMRYGFVGQVTGRVGINTGVKVELDAPWFKLPIRSGRLSASGTSFWYSRPEVDAIPALTAFGDEEANVALIDAMSASSKGPNKVHVATWNALIGGAVGQPLGTGNNTQFDWRTTTDFGFGHCVEWLPKLGATSTGSGWLFWIIQTVPASSSTDTGVTADRRRVWDEILAGSHDAEYVAFGQRLAQKIDASGHPRSRFVLDANHEMNQSNHHRVFNDGISDTRQLYIDAMDRTIRQIRLGAGFRVRFCHRPGFATQPDASGNPTDSIGPYDSFIPTEVDVLALSIHPGDDVINQTTVDQLLAGTLNPNYYGVTNDLIPAATARNLLIAFPEFSPKFSAQGLGLCPVANIFMTRFFNTVVVPNRSILICDCVFNQNVRQTGAYEGTGSGLTQWNTMVTDRQTLWSGIKSANAPVNQQLPHITPTSAVVNTTLTCSQGTWLGTLPITYAYRWRRGTADIAGALGSGQTYLTVTADVGQAISCRVTASNGVGSPVAVISDNSVTVTAAPGSTFVQVAPLLGLTRPAAQILAPSGLQLRNDIPGNAHQVSNHNFSLVPNFTTTNNATLDLRGRQFYHHSTNPWGGDTSPAQVSALRPDNYQNGLIIYGAEVIGEQIDNTIWRNMKGPPDVPEGIWMDDNAIDFQDGGAPAQSTITVEACVFRKSFDGVNTDNFYRLDPPNKVKFIVRGCYAEKQRDEFIENDGLSKLEVYDCLVDSCHNFISMRPGSSSPAVPPDFSIAANRVQIRNCLARCRGQYYTTDVSADTFPFGTKRDPQWEPTNGSIFVPAGGGDPTTYGPGWVHREPFKGDFVETFTNFNATIWVDCRDSIFAFESLPTSRKVVFPPGTYSNVYLLYLPNLEASGTFSTIDGFVDSTYVQARGGITVLAGAAARTMWDTERQNWITAHGGTPVGGVLTFPFTAAPL